MVWLKGCLSRRQEGSCGIFKKNDWTKVQPKRSRDVSLLSMADHALKADSFCVEDIAVWVPHSIIPSFVPSCPGCKSNVCVQVNTGTGLDWVKHPKMLCGLNKHRCLDTVFCSCDSCHSKFAGHNERSMEIDGEQILGLFNMHIAKGFAVDEDLFSCILTHSADSTSTIHKRLSLVASEKWLSLIHI